VAAALEARALARDFGGRPVLRGIDLSLAAGETVVVLGPNGAGKSTLLRILAALTRPTRGEVRVLGMDPFGREGRALRARIGYLGAEPGLYAELSVEENLAFAAQLRGASRGSIEAVLSELELRPVARHRVRTLSLGYRKRAGLARALLGAPALLLLDEPWSGLDAASARRLSAFLAQRLAAGTTLLVAAHGVRDQLDLFQAVLALDAGKLRALGSPGAVDAELA
jgi:heme ABC exporter ATP-binding subunit CcmA